MSVYQPVDVGHLGHRLQRAVLAEALRIGLRLEREDLSVELVALE